MGQTDVSACWSLRRLSLGLCLLCSGGRGRWRLPLFGCSPCPTPGRVVSSRWHRWSPLFKHKPAHTVPSLGPYLLSQSRIKSSKSSSCILSSPR